MNKIKDICIGITLFYGVFFIIDQASSFIIIRRFPAWIVLPTALLIVIPMVLFSIYFTFRGEEQ